MRPTASIFKKVTDVIKMEDAVNKVNDRFKIQKYLKRLRRNGILQEYTVFPQK